MDAIIRMKAFAFETTFLEDLHQQFGRTADFEIRILGDMEPADVLDENGFWELIALLDWSKEGNDDAVMEPVIEALSKKTLLAIHQFYAILSEKLWLLDTEKSASESRSFSI